MVVVVKFWFPIHPFEARLPPSRRRASLATDYHEILPNLIVGTQPTTKGDIDRLRDVEGVTCMFDTQQDKDKEYWNVDAGALRWQMEQRDVKHVHMPFVDFNAYSLREGLPRAIEGGFSEGRRSGGYRSRDD